MNQRVKIIYDEAKKLAPDEREELAELLYALIEDAPEIEKAWLEDVQQRWEEHKASGAKAIDALEAVEQVRRELHGKT